ncbi:type III secretion system gatekeeper subunit SctW [Kalamiella sp. sgz302252]|uniref:type III secretion system gatekeeper subunit SctW n=1 Tax=Pantoea sp. sgz302252 TaxID=3341827 RepID=UPI0036D31919
MAININSGSNFFAHRHTKSLGEKQRRNEELQRQENYDSNSGQITEDESPAAMLQRFAQATDEMSALMSQFNNRRAFERKNSQSAETVFERVLEEEIEPKFDKLVTILKSSEGANIENALKQAFTLFPDESDLAMVLREKLRQRNLEGIVRQRLQKLLAHLEQEANPKRLKAGINVALKARMFAKALMLSPALMRESYREYIQSNDHQTEIYQNWVKTYGAEKRAIVINFMEEALICDIEASDPSCSNIEFGYLLGRLGQIKRIRSSDIVFIENLQKQKEFSLLNADERTLLIFFFGILIDPDSLEEFISSCFGESMTNLKKTEQAKILQVLYMHVKELPAEIFYEEEYRDILIESFLTFNDKALLAENIERRLGD